MSIDDLIIFFCGKSSYMILNCQKVTEETLRDMFNKLIENSKRGKDNANI